MQHIRIDLKLLLLFSLLLMVVGGYSQVVMQPIVPQSGLIRVSQLWGMSVTNVSETEKYCIVELTVRNRVSGTVVLKGRSQSFTLSKGSKMLTESVIGPVTYETDGLDAVITSGGLLAAGVYNICLSLQAADLKAFQPIEHCLDVEVEALTPPQLIEPADTSVLDISYPHFIWTAPMPLTIFSNLNYELVLVEVEAGQSKGDAIQRNLPVWSMGNLRTNTALYPSSWVSLDTGKVYAWQVTARNGDYYGGKSQIWEFRLKDTVPVAIKTSSDFYNSLSRKIYENVIQKSGEYKLEFINEYGVNEGFLYLYEISEGRKTLLKQTRPHLIKGRNLLRWEPKVSLQKAAGKVYTIELHLSNGEILGGVIVD